MREKKSRVVVCLLLVLALAAPAAAQPIDGWAAGWLGWLADAWSGVVEVFGANSTEEEEEPQPAPVPLPPLPGDSDTDECPTCGDTDSGPHIDPNG